MKNLELRAFIHGSLEYEGCTDMQAGRMQSCFSAHTELLPVTVLL